MNIKNNTNGFTVVELIISITILVIIGVIGFMAFTSELDTTRDSSRVESLTNVESNLINYKVQTGYYPMPTNAVNITYSGATVWSQGTFGSSVIEKLNGSVSNLLDPYTKNEYTYSIKNTRKEFQIAGVLEGNDVVSNILVSDTFAETDTDGKAIVKGDYNGQMISVGVNGITYVLSIPSIIATNLSSIDVINIIDNKRLVYNNYTNLPESYKNVYTVDKGINFAANQLVLFDGDIADLEDEDARLAFVEKILESYDGTVVLENDEGLKGLANTELSFDYPSVELSNIVCDIINNKLKFKTDCVKNNFLAIVVESTFDPNFDLFPGNKINIEYTDSNGDLWFGGDKGIAKWNTSGGTWDPIHDESNDLPDDEVTAISESTGVASCISNGLENTMWIGTKKGLVKFDGTTWSSVSGLNSKVQGKRVTDILVDSACNVWTSSDKGLSMYDGSNWSYWGKGSGIPDKSVNDIFEDSSNTIWIATKKGIGHYNGTTWTNYGKSVLPSKKVNIIYQSQYDNTMFFGTNKGIAYLSGVNWNQLGKSDGIQGKKVKTISEDTTTNELYFGTEKGVSVLDWKNFVDNFNDNKKWKHYGKNDDGKPGRKMYKLHETDTIKVWGSDKRTDGQRGKKW